MGHFLIRHTFDCDVDTFWNRVFKNTEFNKELYLGALSFPEYDIQKEETDEAGRLSRRVKITPQSDAPAVVRKALGDSLSYIEEGTWDPSDKKYRYKIIPSTLADKSTIHGTLWAEPKGEGKCERLCEMDITVKVFGVGKVIESFVEKTTKDSYDDAARFTQKWLRENNA